MALVTTSTVIEHNYQYKTLTAPTRDLLYIRLIHLQPAATRSARLECQIHETQILKTSNFLRGEFRVPPSSIQKNTQYQALSYTWGDSQCQKALHVLQADGNGDGSPLAEMGVINITENLHSALQNLRGAKKPLVLWVDAVCINQTDTSERNSQVSNMPQIYAAAERVLVWLGTDDDQHDGRLCLGFFAKLAALITSHDQQGKLADNASWRKRFSINQTVSTFLKSVPPPPITSFLSRPWFRRRWIIQEVVLARDVLVCCGGSSIQWSAFELALTELFENDTGGFSDDNRTTLKTMSRIRCGGSGAKGRQFPLEILIEFASFVCANPRDRLYALYGVFQHWFPGRPGEANNGSVDYALTVGDVFSNFAIEMIRLNHTAPLDGLYSPKTHVLQLAAAMQQQPSVEGRLEPEKPQRRIPSWVPDWTGIFTNLPLGHSPTARDASSGIPRHQAEISTSRDGNRVLMLTGVIHDTITANIHLDVTSICGAVHEAKVILNDFLCSVAKGFKETEFFGALDDNTYQPTQEHIIRALAIALVANWEHKPANSYFAQHPQFSDNFLEQLASSKHHLPEILHKWPAYIELIAITMRGRGLFLTKSGYIGVCAANVLVGDVVCILSDIKIPFILRPNGKMEAPTQAGNPNILDYYDAQKAHQYRGLGSTLENGTPEPCTYRLMGDAYVHGLMNGEAAEGLGSQLDDSLRIFHIV